MLFGLAESFFCRLAWFAVFCALHRSAARSFELCLSVAGFSHLYIWVHYFTTELPDMHRIYGTQTSS